MDQGGNQITEMDAEPITRWLIAARDGDNGSLGKLYETIYPVLHRLASNRPGVRYDGTLQPTAVVNELFLKISGGLAYDVKDRQHFFCTCARAMRFIVADAARSSLAAKRGGQAQQCPLVTSYASQPDRAQELLEIDAALADLDQLDPRLRELVELKYYAGLSHAEIGQLHNRSERSIKRDWVRSRAFLVARSAANPV